MEENYRKLHKNLLFLYIENAVPSHETLGHIHAERDQFLLAVVHYSDVHFPAGFGNRRS
jgi:hypothetical protein